MSIGRFILCTLAVFFTFFALHMAASFLLPETSATMMASMLPEEEMNLPMILTGHLVQTLVIVWIWDKAFANNSLKTGGLYGASIGLFLAGTDLVYFASTNLPNEILPFFLPQEVIVAAIAGVVLAKLYKNDNETAEA